MAKGSGLGKERHWTARGAAAVLLALLAGVSPFALVMPAAAQAQSETMEFNIPAQPVGSALVAYARQAGVQLVMTVEPSSSVRSNPVHGALPPDEALARLLQGTGYEGRFENGALRLRHISADADGPQRRSATHELVQLAQADDAQRVVSDAEERGGRLRGVEVEEEEPIIVVGTNIHGVNPTSPVQILTAEDIERTSATTTEQILQKLPQNLATTSQYGGSVANQDAVAGADLRGLGAGTTLVLLNGRRLSLADQGETVDVSLIPASAIARVEVLTDGASAIYGSDAIGGVVNFVLRDDFDGIETRASFGSAPGGAQRGNVTQTFGRRWENGHGLASFDYFEASALDRSDRSYSRPSAPGTLTPVDERVGGFGTINQDIGERLSIGADLAFAARQIKSGHSNRTSSNPLNHTATTYRSETEQSFANVEATFDLPPITRASFNATFSELEVASESVSIQFNRSPQVSTRLSRRTRHSGLDLTMMMDGSVVSLPAGDLRYSVGGGLLREEYRGAVATGQVSSADLGRDITYLFGELFAPLIGEAQRLPFVHRLQLSLAARYTEYSDTSEPSLGVDFGERTSPKVGLLWSPSPSMDLRATYGESFRAPTLSQLDRTGAFNALSSVAVPFPDGTPSVVLALAAFPAVELEPEIAESATLGFDYRPTQLPDFELEGTYYRIEYTGKIAQPTFTVAPIRDPAANPDILYRPPSADFIESLLRSTINSTNTAGVDLSDPAAAAQVLFANPNFFVQDLRLRNLAVYEQDGIDLSVRNQAVVPWGEIRFGAHVTYILNYNQQNQPSSAILSVVDTARHPVDLRGRVYFGFSSGGFDGTLSVNYLDEYENPLRTGAVDAVDSWTTVDLHATYDFADDNDAGLFDRVRFTLSVQNAFDEDPPYVENVLAGEQFGFDAQNANPLGRLVVAGVVYQW